MPRKAYDQRVMALVEVRGGERDWQEAERLFEARGWPVVEHWSRDEAPIADDVPLGSDARLYKIEIRIFGSAWRAAIGAGWSVHSAARSACLDMQVHRADRIPITSTPKQEWRANWKSAEAAPQERPAFGPPGLRPAQEIAFITGADSAAHKLARSHPTVTRGSLQDIHEMGGFWDPKSPHNAHIWLKRITVTPLFVIPTLCIAFGRMDLAGSFASLVMGVAILTLPLNMSEGLKRLLVLATAMLLFMICVQIFFDLSQLSPPSQIALGGVLIMVNGLWLLVRQWSWGDWVSWLAPLAITLAVSSFIGASSLLHSWYADKLSLDSADLSVPALWQFLAAMKLLTLLLPLLAVPAIWGTAKHLHWVRPQGQMNALIYSLLLALFLVGVGARAGLSVSDAVTRTKEAVRQHTAAPPYFGIRPEWVCLRPTVPVDELPLQGGRLDTSTSYLSLGAADGNLVLLHGSPVAPMKVPVSDLQVIPVEPDVRTCR